MWGRGDLKRTHLGSVRSRHLSNQRPAADNGERRLRRTDGLAMNDSPGVSRPCTPDSAHLTLHLTPLTAAGTSAFA